MHANIEARWSIVQLAGWIRLDLYVWEEAAVSCRYMNWLSSRNKRLKLKTTAGNLPIILEECVESTSNE